ncbi:uncharacterized protein LOC114532328 isoform X2 [Dendronephthya gigantea]|uniref:uncharacterized protein LOC114532328 isoform X2 n=2 Tax=Dendronephthya gigantea TaxID=151771 RepID=UPI001069133B|nr:uncharacterized protein LOC114532328 isoform X2 [Dendronephthya gigantea]
MLVKSLKQCRIRHSIFAVIAIAFVLFYYLYCCSGLFFDVTIIFHNGLPWLQYDIQKQTDHLRNFTRNWLRMHRARTDWQAMLKPCSDQMAWGSLKSGWGKVNRTSARRSYVIYKDIQPSGQFSRIFIQTRTAGGQEKTIGGDFWRVFLTGPANISASVFDHENGTYEAIALLLEPGNYSVLAFLDYTLCDGLRDPPETWFRIGNRQGKQQREGILGFLDHFIYEPLSGGEIITFEVSPNKSSSGIDGLPNITCAQSCRSLWNGFGRWKNNVWSPYIPVASHLSTGENRTARRGTLWLFGDSLAVRFHISLSTKPLCRQIFEQCRRSYNWLYPLPGENEALEKLRNDDLDFQPTIILDSIRDVLRDRLMKDPHSLLLLNLGLHYPISLNFTTFQKLIDDVIQVLIMREKGLGSHARVVWKTTTSIRKENTKPPRNATGWRFFTEERIRLFDAYAMSAMCKAGIEVLDVFPLTASYLKGTLESDIVHYSNGVFMTAEMALETYVKTGATTRVCIK